MTDQKPLVRPARPYFSSGPCAKHPAFSSEILTTALTGRSHRSAPGKARLQRAIEQTRQLLGVPDDYRIGIVPASDTGAMELAMWSLLGQRPVTMIAFESFGEGWVTDTAKQLKLEPEILRGPYGSLPDLSAVHPDHDVVFTWNGTTSGVRVPNADWISSERDGLTICDATSAAFAQHLDWPKLDVTTFSWQKVLGGEAAHGVIILSPRAVARLENYTPPWPLPKIFRLTKAGKLNEAIFAGATINTPSMLCVEDYLAALDWATSLGGVSALKVRADKNLSVLQDWVAQSDWINFLCADATIRSNTSVTLTITDSDFSKLDEAGQRDFVKQMVILLDKEQAAYDLGGYRDAPPGLRIWCGATVESEDIALLTPWLDWAFATIKSTV
ncbi:MAG: phosphoserine transaminase [bacterium]